VSSQLRRPARACVAACLLVGVAAPAAAAADARDVARTYLNDNAGRFGVTRADVADMTVMSSYATAGTGVTHVNLNQRHQGWRSSAGTSRSTSARTARSSSRPAR
jgi:hypothetical protein